MLKPVIPPLGGSRKPLEGPVAALPWEKSPVESLRPWGADTFKKRLVVGVVPVAVAIQMRNCNSKPEVFYEPNPPRPQDRHPIDQRSDVWSAKLQLADLRCQLMSLEPGCPSGTKQGDYYNSLISQEQALIDKVADLEAKYWDKAWGELEQYQKVWQKQRDELLSLNPIDRLGRGIGGGMVGATLGLALGIGALVGVGYLVVKVFKSIGGPDIAKEAVKKLPLGANPSERPWEQFGLTRREYLKLWGEYDFTYDEALRWIREGIVTPELANMWRYYGFTPERAGIWYRKGYTAEAAYRMTREED